MKEPYSEDRASHTGPESCGCGRKGVLEALTGESAGRVLSLENTLFGSADAVDAVGRQHRDARYGKCIMGSPWSKTSSMRRHSLRGNREAPCLPGWARSRWELQGGNPAMNEHGESDRVVVPGKSPNKAEGAEAPEAAEAMEERTLAKENS